jgi:hypothetical protein
MDKASDTEVTSKPRTRGWNYSLGVAGIICGLVGFYAVEVWTSGFFYGFGGLCFAVGRYLSYMESAGPDKRPHD